ncbi:MAG: mucoidy inhibitor MuiA family protein [Deltaproteobacteria bacterium]|nr:mucoidy inhibitor MuiA family protein [Deltaproteobacteria bacterium]
MARIHRWRRAGGAGVLLALGVAGAGLPRPASAAAEAPIVQVVVYGDRAQVTRSQGVSCAAGVAEFSGLPSTVQPESLAAELSGSGALLGLAHEEEASGPRSEAESLQTELRALDQQLAACRAQVASSQAVTRKLVAYREHLARVWARQATLARPPLASWDAALDLVKSQALAASRRQREAERRARGLDRAREALARDLARLEASRRRTTLRVKVHLRCTGRATVRLSYLVPNATFRLAYQARADLARGTVTLSTLALVQQGTGEVWRGAELFVSTANLGRSNLPPKLGRLRVSVTEADETRKVLSRRTELREHLRSSVGDGAEAAKTLGGVGDKKRGGDGAPRDAEPALALKLRAAERAEVPPDGRQVAVLLDRRSLKAELGLESVPKLYPFVYRRLELHNPFPFPMLAGTVELYRGRAYVGRTELPLRAPKEPFALSLGVENDVQVRRYVKREAHEGPGTFGGEQKLVHHYRIEVGNWSRRAVRLRVRENLPVPQVKELRVALDGPTTPPSRRNEKDGVLDWELSLRPREKRVIDLAYTVTLPRSYEVTGY